MTTSLFTSPASLVNIESIFTNYFNKVVSLYWSTHSAHWNIESPEFFSLHKLLDEQYTALWESLDEIAEHMRSLSLAAPSVLPALKAHAYGTSREQYLKTLLSVQEEVISWLKEAICTLDNENDISGADFLTGRLAEHEKMAWMLRASM